MPKQEKGKESFFERYKKKLFGNLFKRKKPINDQLISEIDEERSQSVESKVGFFKKILLALGWAGSKKNKTGRYGAKKARVRNDSFTSPENAQTDKKDFFNPFDHMSEPEASQQSNDFAERVEEQLDLNDANDFEREGRDLFFEERLARVIYSNGYGEMSNGEQKNEITPEIADAMMEGIQKDLASPYDEFQADVYDEDRQPEDFYLSLGVFNDNSHYDEMSREKVGRKFSFKKLLERIFSSKGQQGARQVPEGTDETEASGEARKAAKAKEWEEVAQAAMQKSPIYKAIVARGKAEAKARGESYDPKTDPRVILLRQEYLDTDFGGTGHSVVALGGEKEGKSVMQYSFGFVPQVAPQLGQTVPGTVKNPDGDGSEKLTGMRNNKTYKVSYENFVNAAAKIRGVLGSRRAYTISGYNCTSFALDVADSAGISINQNEVATSVMTGQANNHMVDSPNALASYLSKETDAEISKTDESYDSMDTLAFARDLLLVFGTSSGDNMADSVKQIKDSYKAKLLGIPEFVETRCKDCDEGEKADKADEFFESLMGLITSFFSSICNDAKVLKLLSSSNRISIPKMLSTGMRREEREELTDMKNKFTSMFGTSGIQEFLQNSFTQKEGYLHAEKILGAREEYGYIYSRKSAESNFWADALKSKGIGNLLSPENQEYGSLKSKAFEKRRREEEQSRLMQEREKKAKEVMSDFDITQKLDESNGSFNLDAVRTFSNSANAEVENNNPSYQVSYSFGSMLLKNISKVFEILMVPNEVNSKLKIQFFRNKKDLSYPLFVLGAILEALHDDASKTKILKRLKDCTEKGTYMEYAIKDIQDMFADIKANAGQLRDMEIVKTLIMAINSF